LIRTEKFHAGIPGGNEFSGRSATREWTQMEAKGIATVHYQGKGIVVGSGNFVNKRHTSPSRRIRLISKFGNPPMPADALVN
jgi:hypothetical protein